MQSNRQSAPQHLLPQTRNAVHTTTRNALHFLQRTGSTHNADRCRCQNQAPSRWHGMPAGKQPSEASISHRRQNFGTPQLQLSYRNCHVPQFEHASTWGASLHPAAQMVAMHCTAPLCNCSAGHGCACYQASRGPLTGTNAVPIKFSRRCPTPPRPPHRRTCPCHVV